MVYFAFNALCFQVVDEKFFLSDALLKFPGENSEKIMTNKHSVEI